MTDLSMPRRQFLRASALGLGGLALKAGCGSGPPEKKIPNYIFLLIDDQRWDALGCAGNPIIQTPNMDRMAEEGMRFSRAFVTTPICAASRASIFTGLYERTHGYTFTKPPIRREFTDISYPALLRRAGYRTGFIGKFGVKVEDGVMEEMFDSSQVSDQKYFHEIDGQRRHLTDIHGDRAVEFLRGCNPDEPFCLSLSFWAAHAVDEDPLQYFWPEACDDLYVHDDIPVPDTADPAFFDALPDFLKASMNRIRWHWRFDTPEKFQSMVKGYYRMVSGIDGVIGRLREELSRLNRDRDTIIILMSDNGYFLGERGFAGKWLMHDLSILVPLIIYDPRIPSERRGSVLDHMVLNIDIAPTLLAMAGIDVPKAMQGRSLAPLIMGQAGGWRQEVICEHLWDHPEIPQTECLRTDRWKYIRYWKHPEYEELYDLHNDPHEAENLAGNPARADLLMDLRRRSARRFEMLRQTG